MVKERKLLLEEYGRQSENAREKFTLEKQKACEEEREFARNRYQKQLERDEMEVLFFQIRMRFLNPKFQQQKRKLISEFEEQKHLLTQNFKQEKQLDAKNHRSALELLDSQLVREKALYDSKIAELKKRHADEVSKSVLTDPKRSINFKKEMQSRRRNGRKDTCKK